MPTTDDDRARDLFREEGLTFPSIPDELAARLKEQDMWVFSTREIKLSPYILQHYVCEVDVEDYLILPHSGHGVITLVSLRQKSI